MSSALTDPQLTTINHVIIASYQNHFDAETTIRRLASGGMPVCNIANIKAFHNGKPQNLAHT